MTLKKFTNRQDYEKYDKTIFLLLKKKKKPLYKV